MEFSVSNCEHKLMNILYRLDFNNFYTKQLETLSAERSLMEMTLSQDQLQQAGQELATDGRRTFRKKAAADNM